MPETESNLPVTVVTWVAAFLPIVVLLVLLVWRRWSTSAAAPVALAAAVVVALLLFQTSPRTLAVATGKGIWDAIFVLYVVWPALILYSVANQAGAFGVIQRGVRAFIPDRLLVVLAFAWVLSSFIQGIAGFGAPLAVTAPLLIGLGVRPLYAVVLPLLGRAWGNMFGSLGTTWLATLVVVDIPDQTATLVTTAALLWIPNLTAGVAISWLYGGWWAIRRGGPAIAVISLLHGGLQLVLVPFLPTFGNFIAASAALAGVLLLSRWSFYRQEDENEPDRIFTEEARHGRERLATPSTSSLSGESRPQREGAAVESEGRGRQPMPVWLAFAPYGVLTVVATVALVPPPVTSFLEQFQVGLPFPGATTGYGLEVEPVAAYAAFAPFTHPGTILLISALVGYLVYKLKGFYPAGRSELSILYSTARNALPATTAVVALLIISKVMDHSGEITVLALGIAAISPSIVFVALSNFIGILGALITSSNTASNVLFAPLQATAARAEGLPVELVVASQSAGGATGNAIAPADALLGATVAGIPGRLGAILARALPWTIATGVLIAIASVIIYVI